MSEIQKPTPEGTYSASAEQPLTPALQEAMNAKEAFAAEVRASQEATPHIIDVTDMPGHVEQIEVSHASPSTRVDLGGTALNADRRIPIENPSPQAMASAIGSPFTRDALGRVVPKDQ